MTDPARERTESPETIPSPLYADQAGRLILRDKLAIDRTRLANERTLLSWLRTALMLLVSGATLLKLFNGVLAMQIVGAVLIPIGFVTGTFGVLRYRKTCARISATPPD